MFNSNNQHIKNFIVSLKKPKIITNQKMNKNLETKLIAESFATECSQEYYRVADAWGFLSVKPIAADPLVKLHGVSIADIAKHANSTERSDKSKALFLFCNDNASIKYQGRFQPTNENFAECKYLRENCPNQSNMLEGLGLGLIKTKLTLKKRICIRPKINLCKCLKPPLGGS